MLADGVLLLSQILESFLRGSFHSSVMQSVPSPFLSPDSCSFL